MTAMYSICGTERELNFEKEGGRVKDVANALREVGGVAMVRLEPGDATRYDFWLIRSGFDPRLRAYGVGVDGEEWLWLSPINLSSKGGGTWIPMDRDKRTVSWALEEVYSNPWTVGVMAIWLDLLMEEMKRCGME